MGSVGAHALSPESPFRYSALEICSRQWHLLFHTVCIFLTRESRLPMADRRNATADLLCRWSSTCHCNRVCSMAREIAELQPWAIRDGVRRVRRHCFSAVRVRQVDECRCQNRAIFPAIGLCPAERSVIRRVYGVRLLCASTFVALAQHNTTNTR
jgi:hypothetical protein